MTEREPEPNTGEVDFGAVDRMLGLLAGSAAEARLHVANLKVAADPEHPDHATYLEAVEEATHTDGQLVGALHLAQACMPDPPRGVGRWQEVVSAAEAEVTALGGFHDLGPPEQ